MDSDTAAAIADLKSQIADLKNQISIQKGYSGQTTDYTSISQGYVGSRISEGLIDLGPGQLGGHCSIRIFNLNGTQVGWLGVDIADANSPTNPTVAWFNRLRVGVELQGTTSLAGSNSTDLASGIINLYGSNSSLLELIAGGADAQISGINQAGTKSFLLWSATPELDMNGIKVLGAQQTGFANADGTLAGATTTINNILAILRGSTGHGLISG